MKTAALTAVTLVAAMTLPGVDSARSASPPSAAPSWAFAVNSPVIRGPARLDEPQQVPGSNAHFTLTEIRTVVPDWFPDSHPPMPTVVGMGHKPAVRACAYCHLPNGQGRPENAPLAGLSPDYIAEQIEDFRSGQRLAAAPIGGPLSTMIAIARNVDASDVAAAGAYFSQLHYRPWIRVIETDRVPKTRVVGWMYQPIRGEGAGTEPLGQRIIEVPVDVERTELRDSSSGFIAYVPSGSLARGEQLVRTGADGRTVRCSICHGADLRGLGPVPAIAGRSPSYLMRQLYDIKHEARAGTWTELMREPVARLTDDDMLAIVAYVASLPP